MEKEPWTVDDFFKKRAINDPDPDYTLRLIENVEFMRKQNFDEDGIIGYLHMCARNESENPPDIQ